jgi:MFS family permease
MMPVSLSGKPVRAGLLIPKLAYFTYFAAMGALMPFLVLYYDQIGLSSQQIGLISSLSPLVMTVAAPLWGGMADATQQHRRLLLVAVVGYMLAVGLLSVAHSLLWLLPVVVLYSFCSAPIIPLVDNTVLELLGERKAEYGRQRLWGAIGWGVAGALLGVIVQRYGLQWGFYSSLLLMAAHGLIVTRLPVSHARIGSPYWQGLQRLVTNRAWLVLLIVLFVNGIGMSFTNNFLFLYLHDLGAGQGMMGYALGVAAISELPAFFFADQLLRRWGARGLLLAALTAQVGRMFAYALMPMPEYALGIALLHGLTFSAMWVAAISYANQHAPPGLGATVQGLLAAVSMSLAGIVGALIGGLLYDRIGPAAMFGWAGIVVLGGLLFFALSDRPGGAERAVAVLSKE